MKEAATGFHFVDELERGGDGLARVRPVGGGDHLARELVVLVDGAQEELAPHELHLERLVHQLHAERVVAAQRLRGRQPVRLALGRLVRVQHHYLRRVVVPHHLPEVQLALRRRILRHNELALACRTLLFYVDIQKIRNVVENKLNRVT